MEEFCAELGLCGTSLRHGMPEGSAMQFGTTSSESCSSSHVWPPNSVLPLDGTIKRRRREAYHGPGSSWKFLGGLGTSGFVIRFTTLVAREGPRHPWTRESACFSSLSLSCYVLCVWPFVCVPFL